MHPHFLNLTVLLYCCPVFPLFIEFLARVPAARLRLSCSLSSFLPLLIFVRVPPSPCVFSVPHPSPLPPSLLLQRGIFPRGLFSACLPLRGLIPAATMSFTMHSVFFTLKVSVLLGSLLGLCLGLEFMGLPNQWARYLRWDASTRSDLSFQFKTNVSTGLLLYLDDGGVCDFLCLSLVDGHVQLRFSMDCAETAVLSNKQVNDSSWHFLMVSRDRLRTVLVLDGEGQSGELQPQRPYMDVVSDLFLGGVPADIRPSALTLDGVQAMAGFKGLILDLKYGNSEPQLLGSQGVQLDAEGPCGERPCENGGICFLLDGHPTCDCSTTGYGGKLCSEGKALFPIRLSLEAHPVCWVRTKTPDGNQLSH